MHASFYETKHFLEIRQLYKTRDLKNVRTDSIPFSSKLKRLLLYKGLFDIEQIINCNTDELWKMPSIGRKTIKPLLSFIHNVQCDESDILIEDSDNFDINKLTEKQKQVVFMMSSLSTSQLHELEEYIKSLKRNRID